MALCGNVRRNNKEKSQCEYEWNPNPNPKTNLNPLPSRTVDPFAVDTDFRAVAEGKVAFFHQLPGSTSDAFRFRLAR